LRNPQVTFIFVTQKLHIMSKQIKRQWIFNASPEQVWDHLTKSELIEQWLMPNNFKLEIGHEFQFTTNPIPDLGLSGTFHCKVIEYKLLQKLVYSWEGGLTKDSPTLSTVVEWTLESKEDGTELNLVHSGFTHENETIFGAMYHGWDEHIQKMIKNIN